MERKTVFLDTNIIMDVLCHRNGCAEAATVLNMAIDGNISLYCSSLTVANCIYNCRKILGKETAFLLLKKLFAYIQISPMGQSEVDSAFNAANPDYEDSLQYFSALAVDADIILTRNEKHFRFSKVPVMDCASFLEQVNPYLG